MLGPRNRSLRSVPSSSSIAADLAAGQRQLTPAAFRLLMLGLFAAAVAALGYLDVRFQLQQIREEAQALKSQLAREKHLRSDLTHRYHKLRKLHNNAGNSSHTEEGKGQAGHGQVLPGELPEGSLGSRPSVNGVQRQSLLSKDPGLPLWTEETSTDEDGPTTVPFLPSNSCSPGVPGLASQLYPAPRHVVAWNPRPDKFLVALCYYGRLTNNLMCIQRYMGFAALLNRTLLVPSQSLSTFGSPPAGSKGPSISMAFDISHAQTCLGPGRLFSLEAFLAKQQRRGLDVAVWRWVTEARVTWDQISARLPGLRLLRPDSSEDAGGLGSGAGQGQGEGVRGGRLQALPRGHTRRQELSRKQAALRAKRLAERAGKMRRTFQQGGVRVAGKVMLQQREGEVGGGGGGEEQHGSQYQGLQSQGQEERLRRRLLVVKNKALGDQAGLGTPLGQFGVSSNSLVEATRQPGREGISEAELLGPKRVSIEGGLPSSNDMWPCAPLGRQLLAVPVETGFRRSPIWYKQVTVEKFLRAFGSLEDEAISLGDVFLVEGDETIPGLYEGPNGPLEPVPPCQLIIQPSMIFLKAAEQFVSSVLGTNFIAVHMRRTDFSSHCQREGFNCWFSLRQLAECTVARLGLPEIASSNISTVYLATDASPEEVEQFKEIVLTLAPRPFAFVRLSKGVATHLSGVQLLKEAEGIFLGSPMNLGLLEKLICVHAKMFWGSLRSTFSKDVMRMRLGMGFVHCLDHYLCGQGWPEKINSIPSLGQDSVVRKGRQHSLATIG